MDCGADINASAPSSLRISTENHNHPYALSIASSASSSTSSVFSIDAPSSQSSVSSGSWEGEQDNSYFVHPSTIRQPVSVTAAADVTIRSYATKPRPTQPLPQHPVASECRQHPRRTQPPVQQNGSAANSGPRPPPPLVRQSERKDNFVDSLVGKVDESGPDTHVLTFPQDTTTQMIETIWPLSVMSCGRDTSADGKNQNLIGLRTFVQEVLRRSKTSYSTLQVALYYLVLIQSCLPKHDFTMEQREDSQACRAMQCGRRMFLAALILASKYLQDRNFSARAWSKISGLKACEINANEMAFLGAVNWKLHIPEPVFQRWTDVVLKYSPSYSSPSSPRSSPCAMNLWKMIIPHLTPALDNAEFGNAQLAKGIPHSNLNYGLPSPPLVDFKNPVWSTSNEPTPTASSKPPKTLEPTPRASQIGNPTLPALPRLGPLPTPKMTPQSGIFSNAFSTPAVGAEGLAPRRSSMSIAMEQAQNACTARMTLDHPAPSWKSSLSQTFPTSARRPSVSKSASSLSSPESMISDVSSRSSRSSSISSVSSLTGALPQPRPGGLAAQATRRCANMQLSGIKEGQTQMHPTVIQPSSPDEMSWETMMTGNEISASPDLLVHNNSTWLAKSAPQFKSSSIPVMAPPSSDHQAATALRDLAINCQIGLQKPVPRPMKSRKRGRPNSIDLSVQASVRDLIAPCCISDLAIRARENEDDSTVLPDSRLADSFLVSRSGNTQVLAQSDNILKPILAKEGPRKRTCGNEAKRRAQRMNELVVQNALATGPGMWDGVL